MCPTTQYDTALYLDDHLVAYIDGKAFSTRSTSQIKDCHGNILYIVETGSLGQTLINGIDIVVSFLLKDKFGDNILAYIKGEHIFFSDDIEIKAIDGSTIATLHRNKINLRWYWDININPDNANHHGANPVVLSLLAGKRSFSDSYDGKGNQLTDSCNQYFWVVSWLIVSVLGLLVVLVIIYLILVIKNRAK